MAHVGPVDIAGRTYSEVIATVRSRLTGDFKRDAELLGAVSASCEGHPQATEIRREMGRMFGAIVPADLRARFDPVVDGLQHEFDQGLAQAKAHVAAGDLAGARAMLEDLVRRFGADSNLFLEDSVSEYRNFANDFEATLYERLYRPTRQVRNLPLDRATLYYLYGAVLVESRDLPGAERSLKESLRANPVGTAAMFELGEVMKLAGRKDEFRELTRHAMVVAYTAPALARGYRNLGYLAIEEADYDLALACYSMSLVLDREHARAAQQELLYIEQVTGRTIALPDERTTEASLAARGIPTGPSDLVVQLMLEVRMRRAMQGAGLESDQANN